MSCCKQVHSENAFFCADQLVLYLSQQNNSVSPSDSLRASEKHRSSSDYSLDSKKRRVEEKDNMSRYVSSYFTSQRQFTQK